MPVNIITRQSKGAPLTVAEFDQNLQNIKTAIDANEGNGTGMDGRITQAETNITSLQQAVGGNDAELANHETRMQAVEAHRNQQTGNPHGVTKADVMLGAVSNDAQLKRAGGDINTFPEKLSPVGNDVVLAEDSADAFNKKRVKIGNIDLLGLKNMPPIQPGDASKVLAVNNTENGFEIQTAIASNADTVDSYHALELMDSRPNWIMNGNFDVWQRGETFTTTTTVPCADRWKLAAIGGNTYIITKEKFTAGQIDVPGEPAYFLRVSITAGSGSTLVPTLQQSIEDVRTLAGKTCNISWYAKANRVITPDAPNQFRQYFGYNGSPDVDVGPWFTPLTTSWQKFERTVTFPSLAGKKITDDTYLQFQIGLPANKTVDIDIAQVQLTEGPEAIPFQKRPIALELAMCRRYFEKVRTWIEPAVKKDVWYSAKRSVWARVDVVDGISFNQCASNAVVADTTGTAGYHDIWVDADF